MREKSFPWKGAFFVLVALNITMFFLIFIIVQRYFPAVDDTEFQPLSHEVEEATFLISTDKQRLNWLLSQELSSDDFQYSIELTDEVVQLRSSFQVFSRDVPIGINFLPTVTQNGDLRLEVDSFSLGLLELPISQALQFMKELADLPEWIEVYPSEEYVMVMISNVELEERVSFRFITFDLEQDQVDLEMIVYPK